MGVAEKGRIVYKPHPVSRSLVLDERDTCPLDLAWIDMILRHFSIVAGLLGCASLLHGCSADPPELTSINEAPAVAAVESSGGTALIEGDTIVLEARVADGGTVEEDLWVSWTSNVQGALGERVSPDPSGLAWVLTPPLEAGEHQVTVTVEDPQGATGHTTFTLLVLPSLPPDVRIATVTSDAVYYDELWVFLEGIVTDPESEATELSVWWVVDGGAPITATVFDDGQTFLTLAPLPAGTHSVELWAEDAAGYSDSDHVSFQVLPCMDADSDSFDCHTDCNDGEISIHPGSVETCNGVDDDCDGSTDEGFDPDGDGIPTCP